ncbi:MAG: DUF58 domain-containing protein [Methermicoccaceae archaeon]
MLSVILMGVIVVDGIWMFVAGCPEIKRSTSSDALQVGSTLDVTIEARFSSFMSLDVYETLPPGMRMMAGQLHFHMGGRGNQKSRDIHHYTLRAQRPGRWRFPFPNVVLHSPMSMLLLEGFEDMENLVMVNPRDVGRRRMFKRGRVKYTHKLTTKKWGPISTQEVEWIRRYAPGDSLRDIDWKRTARMQTFIVRQRERKNQPQLIVVIDMEGLDGGKALEIINPLVNVAITKGTPVGFVITRGIKLERVLRPTIDRRYYLKAFHILSTLKGEDVVHTPMGPLEYSLLRKLEDSHPMISTLSAFAKARSMGDVGEIERAIIMQDKPNRATTIVIISSFKHSSMMLGTIKRLQKESYPLIIIPPPLLKKVKEEYEYTGEYAGERRRESTLEREEEREMREAIALKRMLSSLYQTEGAIGSVDVVNNPQVVAKVIQNLF